MKFQLTPLFVALLCAGCVDAQAAAIALSTSIEPQVEARTVVIDNGVVVENETRAVQGDLVAQGSGDNTRRQVHIVTKGASASNIEIPDVDVLVSSAMSEAFAGAANMPMARNIKNAPYSAEIVSEKIQMLPDGNQIAKRSSTLTYRDSAGRTRQETRDSKGDVVSIHIYDTADGTRYVLNPVRKTATKISLDKNMLKHVADFQKHTADLQKHGADLQKNAAELKEKAQALAREGKAQIVERKPGEEIVIHRIESSNADGSKEVREEMKVNVVRVDGRTKVTINGEPAVNPEKLNIALGSALGELSRLGPIGASFRDTKWSAKSTVTQLGSKEFEGVRAEGKSTSYTIPAGEIGNKNPITVTSETWFSPELQAIVYSRNSDPRSGDTIYRLANIKRSEQPIALFTVPEGYALKETPGFAYNFRTEKK